MLSVTTTTLLGRQIYAMLNMLDVSL